MKLLNSFLVSSAVLLGAVATEDVLHSQRGLQRRFIDGEGNYNISFYHVNDVHAHLDEFRSSGTDCDDPNKGCFGGYSRIKHVVDETRPGHKDSLFLNAGDEFQGTLFYSYYGGEKIAETINQLGFDAMTIGNHEFDGGDDKLGAFLENLTFPILSANIVSGHPVLNATIKPFHIFDEYELAVIGVTTETTPYISSPGDNTTFTDVIVAVQNTIDMIKATTNITRIVALTHIGYEEDQKLAESTTGLQLIMGGHSHTQLGDFKDAEGKYPTIKKNKDGDEVFIVTAYRWGEYLGYIDVTFDASGKILAYHGAPIHLTNTTSQDENLQKQIESWREPFEAFAAEVIGDSDVVLEQSNCRESECILGQFMADSMLAYRLNVSSTADCAIINSGGVRATIGAGPVTRGEVLTSFPFGNAVVEIELKGEELWKTLEGVFSQKNQYNDKAVTSTIQVSTNLNVTYNSDNTNGTRLVSVFVGGKELDMDETYNIVTLDFLAGGGDNIFKQVTEFATLDTQDVVLTNYIVQHSPITFELQQRIINVNGTMSSQPVPSNGTTGGHSTSSASGSAPSSTLSNVSLGVIVNTQPIVVFAGIIMVSIMSFVIL